MSCGSSSSRTYPSCDTLTCSALPGVEGMAIAQGMLQGMRVLLSTTQECASPSPSLPCSASSLLGW
jgi:hypothetical protein